MSVSNALRYLGLGAEIVSRPEELERADAVILPGVGAFPDAADKLRQAGMDRALLALNGRRPVLGICLGMQLLLERGEEVRPCAGLGLVQGVCRRIPTRRKLPHIGWNALRFPQPSPLFRGLNEGAWVYFVHSFSAQEVDEGQVLARTDYDADVVAAVHSGSFYGCQFHPEKSGEVGLQILRNFGEMNP